MSADQNASYTLEVEAFTSANEMVRDICANLGLITKIVKRGDGNNISDITTVMVGKQTDHVLKGQTTGPSCGIRI